MRKTMVFILLASLLFVSGCQKASEGVRSTARYTLQEDGTILAPDGSVYAPVAMEGTVYSFERGEHLGYITGEPEETQHLGYGFQTGLFSIQGDEAHRVLRRTIPDNEWGGYYRRTDLPALDIAPEKCIRLELLTENYIYGPDVSHRDCGDGLTDSAEINTFLQEITAGPTAKEAGLYEMVQDEKGYLENCYVYGEVIGCFAEEPNIIIAMRVMSFNDLAYSIQIGGIEYVLPETWLAKLK